MADRELTPKQKKFVDNYVNSGNASEAAREAGYSPKTAAHTGYENLQKPQIQAEIRARMDEAGITEPELLKTLKEGLGATQVKVFNNLGNIIESDPYIDHVTRHKYLETALKLRDMFPSDKVDVTNHGDISQEEFRARMERLTKMTGKNK